MTTYIAKHPGRFVVKWNPLDTARPPVNQVTGYKMVVSDDGQSYDSFVQYEGRPVWLPQSVNKPLSDRGRKALDHETQTGEFVIEQPARPVERVPSPGGLMQRYRLLDMPAEMDPCIDGEWVKYEDAIESLRVLVERLEVYKTSPLVMSKEQIASLFKFI